ncbi:uncharacterized protein LOC130945384 [Arachis stenosperma]|uniref:uncharacterized protein LOC130945384 n=1 Tax=Arachis stenosperma TaxID=217475 RepID=UPI0025AD678C|nr:uncharacterized protein LOC130945384 [Arachis stenosperma]
MNTEQEQQKMEVVGFFGVYQESFKIVQSHTKIFTQITFILILPLLSFIFFIFKQQSSLLFNEILHDSHELTNINNHDTPQYQHLIRKISSKWDTFLFFNFISFTLILIFSILSTTAVVYTVATSIYTAGKETMISFTEVITGIVPKTWKRLMVTFLCAILDFLTYNFLAMLVTWELAKPVRNYFGVAGSIIMVLLYLSGFVYLIMVWKIASVVTLLDGKACGFEAMKKSKELVKGNMGFSISIFLSVNVPFFVILFLFLEKAAFGILCLLVSCHVVFEVVLLTLLCLVCNKSCENYVETVVILDQIDEHVHNNVMIPF